MAIQNNKRNIVKLILEQEIEERDEEELINLIIDNPVAVDVDKQEDENKSRGDRMADWIAEKAGSWTFIFSFASFLFIWIVINAIILGNSAMDPYPFILLNLILSCIAALQAPVIMMSQNRQAKKDSLRNKNDYHVDLKSELILEELYVHMEKIIQNQKKILKYIEQEETKKITKKKTTK